MSLKKCKLLSKETTMNKVLEDMERVGLTQSEVLIAQAYMLILRDKLNDMMVNAEDGEDHPFYQLYEDLCGECCNVLDSIGKLQEEYR
jgi:hypothetical protein